jgi:LDH2 family malate/lactate/ureidoglycolate dehydrogenase
MAITYYADPAEAENFAAALLRVGGGLPQDEAQLMAKCLVQADLRGVVSQASALSCLADLIRIPMA